MLKLYKHSPDGKRFCLLTDKAINFINTNFNDADDLQDEFFCSVFEIDFVKVKKFYPMLNFFHEARCWSFSKEDLKYNKKFGLEHSRKLLKEFKEYKLLRMKEELEEEFNA